MVFQELVQDLDFNNHDSFLKNNLSVVHFFSELKMDCLMVLPIFEGIAEEFNGKAIFGKVNVEEFDGIARKHNVLRVPSILFFKHGNLIDKIEKFNSEDLLRDKIMCLI
ncbi:thioredoxin family protein [Candidatus Pacearchaeota archaeon]|nr:thioredoxin family protein [Candidatus Pacearchaeota archaeon]